MTSYFGLAYCIRLSYQIGYNPNAPKFILKLTTSTESLLIFVLHLGLSSRCMSPANFELA